MLLLSAQFECEDCGNTFEETSYVPEEDLKEAIEEQEAEAREEGWKTKGEYVCPDCREERRGY